MKNLLLLGKNYTDTILYVNSVKNGETNDCAKIDEKSGGIYNFYEVNNWKIHTKTFGAKKAYIISNKLQSTRTSFVIGTKEAEIDKNDIDNVNKNFDWLHVSYVDDLECYKEISNVAIPFSVDFCTDKPRGDYVSIINKAKVLLDSRERKYLYRGLKLETPMIFHDEYGIEIFENGHTVYSENNYPLDNLDVNGAGDIFAAVFLNNYYNLGLVTGASVAMRETTIIYFYQ
jgi:hypothetical protein